MRSEPSAAALVSADILKDGIGTLKTAISDLVDRRPEKTDKSGPEEVPGEVEAFLQSLGWIDGAEVGIPGRSYLSWRSVRAREGG
jgi:hypothetical protein